MGQQFKKRSKAMQYFLMFIFVSSLLAGCGKKEEDNGYYIVETETEQIFSRVKSDEEIFILGTRFYQDEPVQLVGYRNRDPETGEKYLDVFLCRTSGQEEILWKRVPEEYGYGSWYLDEDGNGYCLYLNHVILYDRGGSEQYLRTCEDVTGFTGACMSDNGGILLLGQTKQGMLNLVEFISDTGEFSRTGITLDTESVGSRSQVFIAYDNKNGFLILDKKGIWKADTKKGRKECIMSFAGGVYAPEAVSDFRLLQDGTAESLCGSMRETLRRVDISKERKVLVLRISGKISDSWNFMIYGWLPEGIVRFNKENSEYYVVVDEYQEGESSLAFLERTDMELALGKGPDMVMTVLKDPQALAVKGALENLTPYMEASGIREKDYFPATFDGLRGDDNEIYGVNIVLIPTTGTWFKRELFTEDMISGLDAEGVVSALEAYEENAVYTRTTPGLLNDLLSASDSLCGMVDWENGTCDFTGGMLKRILEACNRYMSRAGEDITVLSGAMQSTLYVYANIYGNDAEMEAREMLAVGCLFDDGQYAGIDSKTQMFVSSASPYKEGAWEFIRFLLSEEEQSRIDWLKNNIIYPSNRKAFETLIAREIAEGSPLVDVPQADGTTIRKHLMVGFWTDVPANKREQYYAITEEKAESVRKMLEEARIFPLRTKQIRAIISEEAAAYFSGDKSVDEVCANIQNRVQLYLSEHQ